MNGKLKKIWKEPELIDPSKFFPDFKRYLEHSRGGGNGHYWKYLMHHAALVTTSWKTTRVTEKDLYILSLNRPSVDFFLKISAEFFSNLRYP